MRFTSSPTTPWARFRARGTLAGAAAVVGGAAVVGAVVGASVTTGTVRGAAVVSTGSVATVWPSPLDPLAEPRQAARMTAPTTTPTGAIRLHCMPKLSSTIVGPSSGGRGHDSRSPYQAGSDRHGTGLRPFGPSAWCGLDGAQLSSQREHLPQDLDDDGRRAERRDAPGAREVVDAELHDLEAEAHGPDEQLGVDERPLALQRRSSSNTCRRISLNAKLMSRRRTPNSTADQRVVDRRVDDPHGALAGAVEAVGARRCRPRSGASAGTALTSSSMSKGRSASV